LNDALRNIPADRARIHICWGNYEGPHDHDIAFAKVAPILVNAKPQALVIEAANPRHEHEWNVWQETKLPDDKVLVPGVLDTSTNYVEHPELVAQRICRFADIVGRERIIAGTDCGFGTFARLRQARSRHLVQKAARDGRGCRHRLQAPLGPCVN
jgi:5-methyltetrahydropteroyltriglutamate--homocysteine methyltransferase